MNYVKYMFTKVVFGSIIKLINISNNLRNEQKDSYNDIIEIPERLFKEKRVRGFVNLFDLRNPSSDHYIVIKIHHNPVDLNSELKLVGIYNQFFSQVQI